MLTSPENLHMAGQESLPTLNEFSSPLQLLSYMHPWLLPNNEVLGEIQGQKIIHSTIAKEISTRPLSTASNRA